MRCRDMEVKKDSLSRAQLTIHLMVVYQLTYDGCKPTNFEIQWLQGGYGLNYFRNRKSAGYEGLDNLFGFLSSFPVI